MFCFCIARAWKPLQGAVPLCQRARVRRAPEPEGGHRSFCGDSTSHTYCIFERTGTWAARSYERRSAAQQERMWEERGSDSRAQEHAQISWRTSALQCGPHTCFVSFLPLVAPPCKLDLCRSSLHGACTMDLCSQYSCAAASAEARFRGCPESVYQCHEHPWVAPAS